MRARASYVASVVAFATLSSAAASGQTNVHLDRARSALDDLDYAAAREQLARAEEQGDNAPDEVAEIYRLAGIVAGAYGKADEAEGHFRKLLAVRPEATPGDGLAPKITEPFARAQAFFADRAPLRVRASPSADRTAIALVVESDPLDMIAGAAASYRTRSGDRRVARVSGAGPFVLTIPRGIRGEVVLAGLDPHGNRVVQTRWTVTPPAGGPRAPPAIGAPATHDVGDRARPVYTRWYLWAGVATGLAATGAYFGLKAQSDRRELDRLRQAGGEPARVRAVEERAQRNRLVTHIALGATAVAGGLAVVCLVDEIVSGDGEDDPGGPTASVAPVPGGAAVSLELGF